MHAMDASSVSEDRFCYQDILKCVIQKQIQTLVNQLFEETGYETIVLSARLGSDTVMQFGSERAKMFVSKEKLNLAADFLNFLQTGPSTNSTVKNALPVSRSPSKRTKEIQSSGIPAKFFKVQQNYGSLSITSSHYVPECQSENSSDCSGVGTQYAAENVVSGLRPKDSGTSRVPEMNAFTEEEQTILLEKEELQSRMVNSQRPNNSDINAETFSKSQQEFEQKNPVSVNMEHVLKYEPTKPDSYPPVTKHNNTLTEVIRRCSEDKSISNYCVVVADNFDDVTVKSEPFDTDDNDGLKDIEQSVSNSDNVDIDVLTKDSNATFQSGNKLASSVSDDTVRLERLGAENSVGKTHVRGCENKGNTIEGPSTNSTVKNALPVSRSPSKRTKEIQSNGIPAKFFKVQQNYGSLSITSSHYVPECQSENSSDCSGVRTPYDAEDVVSGLRPKDSGTSRVPETNAFAEEEQTIILQKEQLQNRMVNSQGPNNSDINAETFAKSQQEFEQKKTVSVNMEHVVKSEPTKPDSNPPVTKHNNTITEVIRRCSEDKSISNYCVVVADNVDDVTVKSEPFDTDDNDGLKDIEQSVSNSDNVDIDVLTKDSNATFQSGNKLASSVSDDTVRLERLGAENSVGKTHVRGCENKGNTVEGPSTNSTVKNALPVSRSPSKRTKEIQSNGIPAKFFKVQQNYGSLSITSSHYVPECQSENSSDCSGVRTPYDAEDVVSGLRPKDSGTSRVPETNAFTEEQTIILQKEELQNRMINSQGPNNSDINAETFSKSQQEFEQKKTVSVNMELVVKSEPTEPDSNQSVTKT